MGLALVATTSLQGCLSPHLYVDPRFHKANYSDLARVEPPYLFSIRVQYQVNSVERPRAHPAALDHIERSLRATGVVAPYEGRGTADGELLVIINDVGNMGAAAAKGFATGLTFGLAGNQVEDSFHVTIRLTRSATIVERTYDHALVTTIGLHSTPEGMKRVSAAVALNQIADDVVLNFLKDMQDSGDLTPHHH